jgi:hypothetical protein
MNCSIASWRWEGKSGRAGKKIAAENMELRTYHKLRQNQHHFQGIEFEAMDIYFP